MRKTRRTANHFELQPSKNNEQGGALAVEEETFSGQEQDDPELGPTVEEPAEDDSPDGCPIALEVWDNIREEFYEQIEQLPLSLQRTFALIGEQDREAQAYQTELLPTIRNYVKLRQALDSRQPEPPSSTPCNIKTNGEFTSLNLSVDNGHKTEDVDTPIPDTNDTPHSPIPNTRDSTVQTGTASERTPSRSLEAVQPPASARSQAREADATVPKSVPFPPKAKPKTSKELLTRISYLTDELIRSSEEKVGLATAANNIVDRHLRALDIAIKELQRPPGNIFHEETPPPVELPVSEDAAQTQAQAVPSDRVSSPHILDSGSVEERTRTRGRKSKRKDERSARRQAEEGIAPKADKAQLAAGETPIDPSEERYCYCNQVSFGEMIACDRPGCPREWYHLGCVGLSAPPKGKWYCKECEEVLHKSKKRKTH